jgi:transcriptional regulator with XRE-family HTH domain
VASLGDAARAALDDFAARAAVPVTVPRATFAKQVDYLERKHGKAGAARAAGVTPATWSKWKSGKSRPSGPSIAKVKGAYEAGKRPELEKLRRTLSAKQRLKKASIQISGTAEISNRTSKRTNFAHAELRGLDLSAAWEIRNRPNELDDYFTDLIQFITDVAVTWPEDDVTMDLLG